MDRLAAVVMLTFTLALVAAGIMMIASGLPVALVSVFPFICAFFMGATALDMLRKGH